jgi:hypothetical protein
MTNKNETFVRFDALLNWNWQRRIKAPLPITNLANFRPQRSLGADIVSSGP